MEAIQKISEDPLVSCPNCSKDALVKKISAAGFRLKGSGWYETDFKKGGTKRNVSGSENSSKNASSDSSSSSSSSDTKSSSTDGGSKSASGGEKSSSSGSSD
jgi:putative FmdB family regulatory protein